MFEKNLLAGKRILVTGGATGLGKSMGKRFLELGASLYICGRREEVLKETADELQKATGGTVKTFSCDVRDNQRVEAMIETFWQDGPLDALVNNAAGNFLCRTEELSIGAFEAVIGIVLMGTIHCDHGLRQALDQRKAQSQRPEHHHDLRAMGLAVRGAVVGGESGRIKPDAQPGD